jgi:hypothetical protein
MQVARLEGFGSIPSATGGIARLAYARLDKMGKNPTVRLCPLVPPEHQGFQWQNDCLQTKDQRVNESHRINDVQIQLLQRTKALRFRLFVVIGIDISHLAPQRRGSLMDQFPLPYAALALQLPICFKVRALSDCLVSSAPE